MWKKSGVLLLALLILLSLTGCMSRTQKKAIYNKAVPIALQYMKDHFNADVVFSDNYQFLDPMNSEIVLKGHMVGDEAATFSIGINHKTFKVNDVGVSGKLEDQYVKYPDKKNKPSTEDIKK
ncbi:hypothetical protein [Paenibacillus sp.]|jgi:hypothetical protein|uniref:hypothetical protein n=1 Tax=Paenibacillus sp. TaxID=58172 RepID=UPI0028381DC0|nr:hypothetical protein [Paenibacillus sp.]MDR0268487.1 hypothetical protein [Paenibacillus sp.]